MTNCRITIGHKFNGQTKQASKQMFKLNSYIMPIHTKTGATVCTPDKTALKQRLARLKRELKQNQVK